MASNFERIWSIFGSANRYFDRDFERSLLALFGVGFYFFFEGSFCCCISGMEEAELSMESEETRLKDGTDTPDGAVKKVCTEINNGNGNMMEEVKNHENEIDSSEEFKEVVNVKEVRDREEMNDVKQIENREEDDNIEETEVVIEKEPRKDVDGKEKEDVDSHDMEGIEKSKDEEKKKEVDVQNVDEVKIGLEGKDNEVNSVLESVEVARDKKAVEGVECNNDKNGLGDDEAVGRKSEEEGRNPIYDKSVNELENDKVEGVEELKDIEHGKTMSFDKDEESILVQVEASDGGKARKEAEDIEMCGAEDLVEKDAADVRAEGKLVVREGEEVKKDDGGNAEKTVGDNQNEESLKRKRGRAQGPSEASEAKKNGGTKENVEEMEVDGSSENSKDVLSSPVVSSSDRPVRERKTVERWVEVIEKAPDRTVIIEKGRGTPLIEIPNVANNLARKKPAELKFLHQTLFGRKGKAVDFKSNLLQFSGFTWHESEEKQRAKAKEKLDKCVKETLLELCDLFDLTVSKTNTRKDEIIVKLLDFMEAPHAMGDAMHAEKQSSKSRKRERAPEVDASKGSGGNFEKKSRQKHDKTEGRPNSDVKNLHDTEDDEVEDLKEDEDEDEDSEEQSQKEEETRSHSKSDAAEKELEETSDEEEDESEVEADLRKGKKVRKSPKGKENKDVKKSPRLLASSDTVKRKNASNSKKNSPKTDGKSSLKTPPSKHSKAEKSNDTGEKALSRKKKDAESPKKSNSKSNSKEKSSGKASKSKRKSGKVQKSGPTKAELLKSISEILKKVDFNTATFTDILELLASEYKIDLTPRKAAIKLLIQDELTKMVDEEEESQDEEMQ